MADKINPIDKYDGARFRMRRMMHGPTQSLGGSIHANATATVAVVQQIPSPTGEPEFNGDALVRH
jgi:hypothetical protein